MPTREEALAELYRRGKLDEKQTAAVEELARRGKIQLPQTGAPLPGSQPTGGIGFQEPTFGEQPLSPRQQFMQELAQEVGPLESFLIGAGRGFTTVGRGLGLAEPETETERMAMEALAEERPISMGAGEVIGEAAPFVPLAAATGGIAPLAGRAAATGAVGALEAGLIQAGKGGDIAEGALAGGAIGVSAELLFPIVGKLGRKVFQRVTGKVPRGSMLDAAGRPTQELQQALDSAGMTFDDLTQDAVEVIQAQRPGAAPEQVARQARAAEAGVPLTRGELTRGFPQQFKEQRLLESAGEEAAEPFRQFKLKQSEAIKQSLESTFGAEAAREETGQVIKDALTGRKKLLRTQKNQLYEEAAERAEDIGGVPVFTDNISEVVPDADTLEDLAITAPQAIKSLDQILTKYGIKEATPEAIEAGFQPTPLTIKNIERFRKTLNSIERGDQTGAVTVATGPIKNALDDELAELGATLQAKGFSGDIIEPLRQARKTVRQLKTEFSPQAITGRLIDVKKDGVTEITEASKVYDKLSAKSTPVEDIRRVVKSLSRAEGGKEAIGSLQTTTIMDLIEAGFGTESRKISGVKVFNPTAFKKRMKAIGDDKLKAIFSNNKETLKKLKNIDSVASDLIPEAGAMPKGSSSSLLDLAGRLISTKIPGGNMALGALSGAVGPVKTAAAAKQAVQANPEVIQMRSLVDKNFPGIAAALGIATFAEEESNE